MIIPTGFAHVAIPFKHLSLGRRAFITFGVHVTGGQPGPVAVADDAMTAFQTSLGTTIDSQVTYGAPEVIYNLGGTELVGTGTSDAVGSSADARPPGQVAVLLSKRTGVRGRKNRGRFYLPWAVTEAAVDEVGNIDSSTVSDFQDLADDFLTNLVTAGLEMVILHNSVGTPTDVIQLLVSPLVATQRRRLGDRP